MSPTTKHQIYKVTLSYDISKSTNVEEFNQVACGRITLLATEYDLVVLVGGTAFACQIETKRVF